MFKIICKIIVIVIKTKIYKIKVVIVVVKIVKNYELNIKNKNSILV